MRLQLQNFETGTVGDMQPHLCDSDCLAVIPDTFSDWQSCVDAWNDILAYAEGIEDFIRELLVRCNESSVLDASTVDFFENILDRWTVNLQRASELRSQLFHRACVLRYGLGLGSVFEVNEPDAQGTVRHLLLEIDGGGLPRRNCEPTLKLSLRVVEPYHGGWLSARPSLMFSSLNPDQVTFQHRPDIKATHPGDSPFHWFPLELGGDELFEGLSRKINPSGSSSDRKSVLLAFWQEGLHAQRKASSRFQEGDIIAVMRRATRPFHVAYQGEYGGRLHCYDPREVKTASLMETSALKEIALSARTRLQLVRARSTFSGATSDISNVALHALALRENLRFEAALDSRGPG